MRKLVTLILDEGLEPINPWDLTDTKEIRAVQEMRNPEERRRAWQTLNTKIGERNREGIDSCEIVLACLDGPDVDSGTASEVGYAFGRGKKVIGYRGDFRMSGDNEASVVNLQVQYWIDASGGSIVRSFGELPEQLRTLRRDMPPRPGALKRS